MQALALNKLYHKKLLFISNTIFENINGVFIEHWLYLIEDYTDIYNFDLKFSVCICVLFSSSAIKVIGTCLIV